MIKDVSFQGSGCAISKASASLMTESVKGKTIEEAKRAVRALSADDHGTGGDVQSKSRQADGAGRACVSFPVRVKCASLAWHTLRSAVDARSRRRINGMTKELPVIQPSAAQASAKRADQETAGMVNDAERSTALKPQIIKALSTVYDPEIPVNIYELGLIYDIIVDASSAVGIRMTLTAPACPAAQFLPEQVRTSRCRRFPECPM